MDTGSYARDKRNQGVELGTTKKNQGSGEGMDWTPWLGLQITLFQCLNYSATLPHNSLEFA